MEDGVQSCVGVEDRGGGASRSGTLLPSWFFEHRSTGFHVLSLISASIFTEFDADLRRVIGRLRACLKRGSLRFRGAFLDHLLASLHSADVFRTARIWGWYPSSNPRSSCEVMKEFCEVARSTFGQNTHGPLFIRHTSAIKRHLTGRERTDPGNQLTTMSVNPSWRGEFTGETVVVFDDYLTFGLSFGVAGALLRAAGAASVIGVAMGKFPSKAKVFDIRLKRRADLFAPLRPVDFSVYGVLPMTGVEHPEARGTLKARFRFDNG